MIRRAALLVAGIAAWLASLTLPAAGVFRDVPSISGNTFSTATLASPTGHSAEASCSGGLKVTLTWTASTSSFADGYDAYRSTADGGPYTSIAHVSGRTTAAYSDDGVTLSTTYFYVLQSTANNWTSLNSTQASASTPASC